jgi:hypothetical protein
MEAYQGKLDRYLLLAAMVQRQILDGPRTAAPLMLPVRVSTHGEFCPVTVQLQEWLLQQYRARLRLEGEREDGEKENNLITSFRYRTVVGVSPFCDVRRWTTFTTSRLYRELSSTLRKLSKSDLQVRQRYNGSRDPRLHRHK